MSTPDTAKTEAIPADNDDSTRAFTPLEEQATGREIGDFSDGEQTAGWEPPDDVLPDVNGAEPLSRLRVPFMEPDTTHVDLPVPPCRCDGCKYGHRPGTAVVLYTGPGAVDLMVERALRDGRYEDVEAVADAAWMKVHEPAVRVIRRISRRFGPVESSIYSALYYEPGVRTSPKLAEGLHRIEAALEQRLAEMRAAAGLREAELRHEAGSAAA